MGLAIFFLISGSHQQRRKGRNFLRLCLDLVISGFFSFTLTLFGLIKLVNHLSEFLSFGFKLITCFTELTVQERDLVVEFLACLAELAVNERNFGLGRISLSVDLVEGVVEFRSEAREFEFLCDYEIRLLLVLIVDFHQLRMLRCQLGG